MGHVRLFAENPLDKRAPMGLTGVLSCATVGIVNVKRDVVSTSLSAL